MTRCLIRVLLVSGIFSLYALAGTVPDEPRYRGFTVASLDQETLQDAVRWNANQVRYMMCPVWWKDSWKQPSYQATWQKILEKLPADLDRARALGLAVVLDLHNIPNDHPKPYSSDPVKASHEYWYDESNLKVLVECWQQVAEICKDRDQVIWFDLLNEPLDWTLVHSSPCFAPTLPDWYQKTINAIRRIDKRHPIAVEPGPGMLSWGFNGFPLLKDPCQKIIYSVHVYQPVEYTHQGVNGQKILPWPGVFGDGGGGMWNKDRLLKEYSAAIEYQKKYNVRIWVGEFSAARWAPGAADYLRECIEMFEKFGWDWNYHALREAQVWNLELGDEVDFYDARGNYVRTGIADPKSNLQYLRYGTPEKHGLPIPTTLPARARVLKDYLDRNKKIVRKILIIGNSITRHDPNKELGWPYDNGMAATSPDKDFVHLVYKRICAAQPEFKPELKLGRITDEAHMKGFESLIPCDADLIIVELGDNFRGEVSVAGVQKSYEAILAALQKNNNQARLYCLSTWWGGKINTFIKAAAKNRGATFIDMSPLIADSKNRASSEGHFTHPGVNEHPGDRGMKAIADIVWQVIK